MADWLEVRVEDTPDHYVLDGEVTVTIQQNQIWAQVLRMTRADAASLAARLTLYLESTVHRELVCPECRDAKHGNCDGTALDPEADEIIRCQCSDRTHHG